MADILKSCGKWYKDWEFHGASGKFKYDPNYLYAGFIVKVKPNTRYTLKVEWNSCSKNRRFNILPSAEMPRIGGGVLGSYFVGTTSESERTESFMTGSNVEYVYIYLGYNDEPEAHNLDKILKNVELTANVEPCSNPALPEGGKPIPRFSNTETDCDKPLPPPEPEEEPNNTDSTNCSTSGIHGGHGQKLTDIKLFLYADKVTKGTITLSKPQLEVGTYATDWRPNPTDLVQVNTESLTKKLEELTKKIELLEPKEVRKGGKKSGKKRD